MVCSLLYPVGLTVTYLTRMKLTVQNQGTASLSPELIKVLQWVAGRFGLHNTDLIDALFIAAAISAFNVIMWHLIVQVTLRLQKPKCMSEYWSRVMRFSSFAYIVNMVVCPFMAHSHWLLDDTSAGSVFTAYLKGLEDLQAKRLNCWVETTGGDITACASSISHLVADMLMALINMINDERWYLSTGLLPQIIVLGVFDVAFLGYFHACFDLFQHVVARFVGRTTRNAQAYINVAYEPPNFTLHDRYAALMKHIALILLYAPAAPILYPIGVVALSITFYNQKFAVCKMYRKPASIDENIASEAYKVLHLLLFLRVIASAVFYLRHAITTGSDLGVVSDSPFVTGVIVAILFTATYLLPEVFASEEEADDEHETVLRYQEARDQLNIGIYEPRTLLSQSYGAAVEADLASNPKAVPTKAPASPTKPLAMNHFSDRNKQKTRKDLLAAKAPARDLSA